MKKKKVICNSVSFPWRLLVGKRDMNSGGVRGLIGTVAAGRPAWMWHPGVTLCLWYLLFTPKINIFVGWGECGLSLIRFVTDYLLCGFHVLGGLNTGGNLLLFLFWFVFFPGKLFWYQKDNVSYHQFSAHVHHLAQAKSQVAARPCPAAKHFHWGKKNILEQELGAFGQFPVSFWETGTGMRSWV